MKGQTASRALTAQLVRSILEGDIEAGEKLPTERELAESYGVSRHVVREALKRLEALSLLRIQQGSGAYVSDVSLTGGLELIEYILIDAQGQIDVALLSDFFDFWLSFAKEVIERAARHRTQEDIDALFACLQRREEALEDHQAFVQVSREMFRLLARSTHNRVYQMIFNNLGRVLVQVRDSVPLLSVAPIIPQSELRGMLEAIARGDAEAAGAFTTQQVELVRQGISALLTSKIGAQ